MGTLSDTGFKIGSQATTTEMNPTPLSSFFFILSFLYSLPLFFLFLIFLLKIQNLSRKHLIILVENPSISPRLHTADAGSSSSSYWDAFNQKAKLEVTSEQGYRTGQKKARHSKSENHGGRLNLSLGKMLLE